MDVAAIVEVLEKEGYEIKEEPNGSKTCRKPKPARRNEINRANSARSTGPKSAKGKTIAAQNATKHGILSCNTLISGENAEDFYNLLKSLRDDLQPIGSMESLLLDRLVEIAWRRHRLAKAEAGIFKSALDDTSVSSQDESVRLGAAFYRSESELRLLSRYEATLDNTYYRTLHELQRLQAGRAGRYVPPPIAADVTLGVVNTSAVSTSDNLVPIETSEDGNSESQQ